MRASRPSYVRSLARVRADRARIVADFNAVVNMSAGELAAWLDTDASNTVGWRYAKGEESVGHRSGRRIVQILNTPPDQLTDGDLLHMRTVIGFVRRHLARRPHDDVTSRWASSLKNWGHNPTRS